MEPQQDENNSQNRQRNTKPDDRRSVVSHDSCRISRASVWILVKIASVLSQLGTRDRINMMFGTMVPYGSVLAQDNIALHLHRLRTGCMADKDKGRPKVCWSEAECNPQIKKGNFGTFKCYDRRDRPSRPVMAIEHVLWQIWRGVLIVWKGNTIMHGNHDRYRAMMRDYDFDVESCHRFTFGRFQNRRAILMYALLHTTAHYCTASLFRRFTGKTAGLMSYLG